MQRAIGRIVIGVAAALVVVAVALLVLLEPIYVHAALDASGSAAILGVTPAEAHRLSDATVGELFVGPGTFELAWRGGSFYDAAEAGHLRDVRTVLWAFLALAAAAAVVLLLAFRDRAHRAAVWRSIARGAGVLAIGTVVVGVLFEVAFEPMFTLFHELVFPGGNWAFDPTTERLVQLYPIPFWELTATVLALLILAGSSLVWWLASGQARRLGSGGPAQAVPTPAVAADAQAAGNPAAGRGR